MQEIPSPFNPPSARKPGIILTEERAAAYIFNTVNIGTSIVTGGHAVLALEALIDGKYIAIRSDIRASVSSGWFSSSKLISDIKYKALEADYADPEACSHICDIIFHKSDARSSASTANSQTPPRAERVHAENAHVYKLTIDQFRKIKEQIFTKQKIFVQAYINSILSAEKDLTLKGLLYDTLNGSENNGIKQHISTTENGLSARALNTFPNASVFLYYCESLQHKLGEKGRLNDDNAAIQGFIKTMPNLLAILHKQDLRGKLDPKYPKYTLFGNRTSHNCLTWAKHILEACEIRTDIKTSKPKKI